MQLEARKYLFDMRQAAELIARFTAGRTLEDYAADPMLRSAVERQLEILGEALGRLKKSDPEIAGKISDYRRIIAFRNVLIHGYDAILDEVVWGLVETQIPAVRQTLSELLATD
ncbi:MAG TPA: HepT-like ribonuclease domain-containing protein [Thermoanaerobaculia bacterium]|nr:HepT-like ribonuclease domain-containing protein [Thermoanaerobaculia bacterium]